MAEIKATLVPDIWPDDEPGPSNLPAGSFEYFSNQDRETAGIIFICPCGCGKISALDFTPHAPPAWTWDGNREAPTLSPSVHDISGPDGSHWHGWLQGGVWRN